MNRDENKKYFLSIIVCVVCSVGRMFSSSESEEAFTHIYKNKVWGVNERGEGYSGGGSTLQETTVYRKFLQDFLKEHNIKSVVDAGCGDWTFSKTINWDGIEYTGIDVVKSVIAKNKVSFGKQSIRFLYLDITTQEIPSADLLICKDVLQHLPNATILRVIGQFKKFKYCLITNDINLRFNKKNNVDILFGQWRALDLTEPPFLVKGKKILTYRGAPGVLEKQVLFVQQ